MARYADGAGYECDSDQERDEGDVCAHCLSAPASIETEHGDAVCARCFAEDEREAAFAADQHHHLVLEEAC